MVPEIPPLSYREVDALLRKEGFSLRRQTGSHAFYAHPDGRTTVVPRHGRDVTPRLVHKILRDAGLDPAVFGR